MSTTVSKVSGLDTSDNPLSSVKDGSLKTADNVVIRSKNILESRRGQYHTGGTFGTSGSRAQAITYFAGGSVVNSLNTGTYSLSYGTTTYTDVSGITPPAPNTLRMQFAQAGQSLYFTTTTGISAMDGLSTPRVSGAYQATDSYMSLTGNPDATGAWLPADSQVAYRVVFVDKDANSISHVGPPSGRSVVVNPADITTSTFLSKAAGVVTATFATTSHHGFQVGDTVQWANPDTTGATPAAEVIGGAVGTFNVGPFTITAVTATTIVYTDAAGTGSGVLTHKYTSGRKLVAYTIPPIGDVSVLDYVRIYRSAPSASATTAPSDELYLVWEAAAVAVATDYTGTDNTPDLALYSTPLYTNELTGEGALQANYLPPYAQDITPWKDRLWFANTTGIYNLTFQCLGVSAPQGWQSGDTITIGGIVYTAGAADSGNTIGVRTAGTVTENTAATMRRLVYRINENYLNVASAVRAFYISGTNDAPGKIRLEAKNYAASTFTFATSRAAAFNPAIASVTSTRDVFPNRVFYSKVLEPEAVPLLNYLDIGSKTKAVLRILPLRERLYVFKEDAIYTISGDAPNLRVDMLDNTAWLLAPDSAVVANNQIFCLTNHGVVTVGEGGVAIISRPIADKIDADFTYLARAFLPYPASDPRKIVWGAAYESENVYLLGLTSVTVNPIASPYAQQVFAYNYLNATWTRWPVIRAFAAVDPSTDLLKFASSTTNQLIYERKTLFGPSDYSEDALTVTCTSTSGATITLSSATGVGIGDYVHTVDALPYARVAAVNGSVLTLDNIHVDASMSEFVASLTVETSIPVTVEFNPVTEAPGEIKQFALTTLHFNKLNVYDFDITTRTELVTSSVSTAGTTPAFTYLATAPLEIVNVRRPVPLENQRAALIRVGFYVREAQSMWQINGFTVEGTKTSERNSR